MKKILYTLLIAITAGSAFAQDIHFTQFHAMPMYLNPAMTGFFNGDIRVGAIYRNQWFSLSSAQSKTTYQTFGGYADGCLLRRRLKGSFIGIGGGAVYDMAGDMGLNTLDANFNIAYSQSFGRRTKHSIALGLQGLLSTKSIGKPSNAITPDGLPDYFGRSASAFDVGFGLRYHVEFKKRLNMYIGGAYAKVLRPTETLVENANVMKTYSKITASAGALIDLNDKFNIMPQAMFVMQGPAYQVNVGSYFQYVFGEVNSSKNGIALGFFTRFAQPIPDAIAPAIRLDYAGLQASFSYDFTISDFRRASPAMGAAELSVSYLINFKPAKRIDFISCPRF
jgi:type IX secretion system PorP/SprF family membrane protein